MVYNEQEWTAARYVAVGEDGEFGSVAEVSGGIFSVLERMYRGYCEVVGDSGESVGREVCTPSEVLRDATLLFKEARVEFARGGDTLREGQSFAGGVADVGVRRLFGRVVEGVPVGSCVAGAGGAEGRREIQERQCDRDGSGRDGGCCELGSVHSVASLRFGESVQTGAVGGGDLCGSAGVEKECGGLCESAVVKEECSGLSGGDAGCVGESVGASVHDSGGVAAFGAVGDGHNVGRGLGGPAASHGVSSDECVVPVDRLGSSCTDGLVRGKNYERNRRKRDQAKRRGFGEKREGLPRVVDSESRVGLGSEGLVPAWRRGAKPLGFCETTVSQSSCPSYGKAVSEAEQEAKQSLARRRAAENAVAEKLAKMKLESLEDEQKCQEYADLKKQRVIQWRNEALAKSQASLDKCKSVDPESSSSQYEIRQQAKLCADQKYQLGQVLKLYARKHGAKEALRFLDETRAPGVDTEAAMEQDALMCEDFGKDDFWSGN